MRDSDIVVIPLILNNILHNSNSKSFKYFFGYFFLYRLWFYDVRSRDYNIIVMVMIRVIFSVDNTLSAILVPIFVQDRFNIILSEDLIVRTFWNYIIVIF